MREPVVGGGHEQLVHAPRGIARARDGLAQVLGGAVHVAAADVEEQVLLVVEVLVDAARRIACLGRHAPQRHAGRALGRERPRRPRR